jgi:acetyltransferase-like isoleucine patch superfamily enzyme
VIGNNVFIGPNTSLLNDKYPPSVVSDPPTIQDDAVIGGGVTILPGVVIGTGAKVGAGSVVTKDVPPKILIKFNQFGFSSRRQHNESNGDRISGIRRKESR